VLILSFHLTTNKLNIDGDSEVCKTCKKSCCCSSDGYLDYLIFVAPEDVFTNKEHAEEKILEALKTGLFRITRYCGSYIIATAVSLVNGKHICDFMFSGGCILPADSRPISCRMTIVNKRKKCPTLFYSEDVLIKWNEYQFILEKYYMEYRTDTWGDVD